MHAQNYFSDQNSIIASPSSSFQLFPNPQIAVKITTINYPHVPDFTYTHLISPNHKRTNFDLLRHSPITCRHVIKTISSFTMESFRYPKRGKALRWLLTEWSVDQGCLGLFVIRLGDSDHKRHHHTQIWNCIAIRAFSFDPLNLLSLCTLHLLNLQLCMFPQWRMLRILSLNRYPELRESGKLTPIWGPRVSGFAPKRMVLTTGRRGRWVWEQRLTRRRRSGQSRRLWPGLEEAGPGFLITRSDIASLQMLICLELQLLWIVF